MLREWLELVPDPAAVVTADGSVSAANRGFEDLLRAANCARTLGAMFGHDAIELLARARRGPVHNVLQFAAGDPAPFFRVSLSPDKDPGRLVVMLADASEEMACRQRLADRDRDLAVLRDLGANLSGTLDLADLGERIYTQTRRVICTKNLYVALHDVEDGTISFPKYIEDGVWKELTTRPFGKGLTEYVIRTGQPLLFNNDVRRRAEAIGIEPQGREAYAFLAVPVVGDGAVLGVIGIQDFARANRYGEHDLQVLTIIASQAGAAIRTCRLLAAARRAYEELSETQARLLEAERLRGIAETAGAMNHEINNPLSAIAGNAQLLMRRAPEMPPDTIAKIDAILEATRRIQSVTQKVATLISATSMPYPSGGAILDVRHSLSMGEAITARSLFPPN